MVGSPTGHRDQKHQEHALNSFDVGVKRHVGACVNVGKISCTVLSYVSVKGAVQIKNGIEGTAIKQNECLRDISRNILNYTSYNLKFKRPPFKYANDLPVDANGIG